MPLTNYEDWFENNDKSVSRATSEFVFCDGAKFFFHSCMNDTSSGYRGILGYGVVGNRLACRMWYYSNSEASWRASTGLRKDGSWQKGYEADPNPTSRKYTAMGYIFECLVTVNMSNALETFWAKTDSDEKIFTGKRICPPKMVMNASLNGFLKNPNAKISEDYNQERIFKLVILPVVDEIDRKAGIASSTYIQGLFSRTGNNLGKEIRTDTDMDAWLTECLKKEKGKRPGNDHPILGQKYDLFEYSLADKNRDFLTLEIAATTVNSIHKYTHEDGAQHNLETKICWVRDVYYNNTVITSFGTRKHIPINLSFLVQKPIDYIIQVSEDYLMSISESTYHKKIKEVFKMPVTTVDGINARNEEIYGLLNTAFSARGGYKNSYIILSYLNESTSTLIHEFKSIKNIPSFVRRYNKVGNSSNTEFNHGELALFDLQKKLIIGINEYYCLRLDPKGYSTKGHHGDTGLDRASALREAILGCKNESELNLTG